MVENNNKFLVGKKKLRGFLSGQWHLPGEKLEEGESEEEALKRGLREEVGIGIEKMESFGSVFTDDGTLVNWYLCKTSEETIIVGSDLDEARWVNKEEVTKLIGDLAKSRWSEEVRKMFEG